MKRRFNKAHRVWRDKVLTRDSHKCVVCGKGPKYLNAHHLIPSEFVEFAFDVSNGITLCPHHHTLGKLSAHKHPLWFSEWLAFHRPKMYLKAMERIDDDKI